VRDADELHDALLGLWLVPEPMATRLGPDPQRVADWFSALTQTGRACRMTWVDPELPTRTVAVWVATERLGAVRAVIGEATSCLPMIATPAWSTVPEREVALVRICGAHLDHRGPVSARGLAAELGLALADVLGALLALEGDGAILRGAFTAGAPATGRTATTARAAIAASDDPDVVSDLEWCNRRVLARIHRLTLARLRKEIEPVSAAALMRFLLRWQRVARHGQLIGADGLLRIVEQLQGFETAAGAWEREILPARLHGYDQTWLDQLCLAGQVVWCRLSPRRAAVEAEEPAASPVDRPRPDKDKDKDKKPTRADKPSEPYNLAEAGAEAARLAGASRDEIAAAAATAIKGKCSAHDARVIVGLVTTSAMLKRGVQPAPEPAVEAPASKSSKLSAAFDRARSRAAARPAAPPRAAASGSTALDPREAFAQEAMALIADEPALDGPVIEAPPPPPARPHRSAPSRSAPLALVLRVDASWLRSAAAVGQTDAPVLSPEAARIRDHLAGSGASFLTDLVAMIDLAPDEIEDALWELVGAGLATADGFASLRVLVSRRRGEVKSHFDRHQDRMTATAPAAPPVRKWQEAIKKARNRDRERPGHALRALPTAAGRWSLLPPTDPEAIDAEASARQLLLRYGVVFRDLLLRESSLPPWRDLLVALRRLEARGEIRGGRFVSGFVGEQFALPEAADELRAARNPGPVPEVCRVAATDPVNLVGVLSPGPKVPAVVGNLVLYIDGHAVASLEAGQVVHREAPAGGGRIDDELNYHPPPRPAAAALQTALPL
ncbi:MAG TPA: hypothetical protein VGC42_24660, partial [Kofleriaceae bacterium]